MRKAEGDDGERKPGGFETPPELFGTGINPRPAKERQNPRCADGMDHTLHMTQ